MNISVSDWLALMALGFTVLAAIVGIWWRMEMKIIDISNENLKANQQVHVDLAGLRTHLAEKYAPLDAVHNIENRLAARIDQLNENIKEMPEIIINRLVVMIKNSKE